MGPRGLPTGVLLASALLLGAAPEASAASLAPRTVVSCDALVGFNGTVREDRFAPVILTVENPGARLTAQITLTVTWGGFRPPTPGVTISREAVLDAGSTLRFPFVIPVRRSVRQLRVSVTSAGTQVGGLAVELRPLTTASRLIASVTSDLSFDGLSALGGSAGALRVVYPRVDDLPQSWAGWDGVDAVIVHDTYFQQLRSDQVEALERWVDTGGILVFTGGAAALQHAPAGFGPLMPVHVDGLVQKPGLASVPVGGGALRSVPGQVEVAVSRLTSGTVVTSDGGLPLVVQRRIGRGSVWFLAFDPTAAPMSSWTGALAMWRGILEGDRLPALGKAAQPAAEDPWVAAFLGASAIAFPPVLAALVFVGAYLLLLAPLLVSRAGRPSRTRVRLALLVGVCAAASAAGWLLFGRLLFEPGLQVIDTARVEARSGDGLAEVTEKLACFASAARPVEATLGSAGPVLEAAPVRTRSELPPTEPQFAVAQSGSRARITGLEVGRLAARLLVAHDVVPFDVDVSVQSREGGLSVVARNGNARPLLGCFILVSGRAFLLGDIQPGVTARRTFSAADGLGSASDGVTAQGTDTRRAALFKVFSEEGLSGGASRLIGWMDGPVVPFSFVGARPAGERPGIALVSVEVE